MNDLMRQTFESECFCKSTDRNDAGYFDTEVQMKWNVFQKAWRASSRAGFIAGVVWSRTDTDNKSLNTAADDYSAGKPL